MSRGYKPIVFSLDPDTEAKLNLLMTEQKQWRYNRSAMIRSLINRAYRSHSARKRSAAPAAPTEGEPTE